jgi:murein DD-endopeptidase MepM/ murein hydrolase activator NlpD
MAYTTTRPERGERWRTTPATVRKAIRTLVATAIAASILQIVESPVALAQVTPPSKKTLKVLHKAPTKPQTKQSNDNEADQLNEKWLSEFNKAGTDKPADPANAQPAPTPSTAQATPTAPAAPAAPAAAQAPTPAPAGPQATVAQARAAASVATAPAPIQPSAPTAPVAAAPTTPASVAGTEDERTLSSPSSVAQPGAGSRAVVPGTVTFVKADNAGAAFNSMPGGANQPVFKDLNKAFSGFAPNAGAAKVEMMRGRTADGSTRLLYAAIGEGKDKKSYWWFSPPDQPDGWFDNTGHRLGGSMLSEPKPDSHISSPFGKRRYYGRTSGVGFHNGIDFEGKVGDPIYAAADGVVNHAGWYFNYGRTVKISHADNFETLYAHMSRLASGIAPGSYVHQGDVIGYVGSTGRSTGPHLHFSAIVDGQFVDPAPYISENGGNTLLSSQGLVSFRQWQGEIRAAAVAQSKKGGTVNVQGPDPWSTNPFTPPHTPGHL